MEWTAIFAGQNGSPNVFNHFDANPYTETTTDPATLYLRRAPAIPAAAELAVSCGSAMVKFPLTEAARAWMTSGTQASWISLSPTVLTGSVANAPNSLWTGSGGSLSFIFAKDQGAGASAFASSYSANTAYDDCNGLFDQSSIVRVFYREPVPTAASFAVVGRVVTLRGAPVAGVTMTVADAVSASVVRARTSRSGRFRFTLTANRTYVLAPAKRGFTFSPRAIALTPTHRLTRTFTARRTP